MADYPSPGTPMEAADHPAHNVPTATEHYSGKVLTPDFSGKVTGSNHPPDWQDQHSVDNYISTVVERGEASSWRD